MLLLDLLYHPNYQEQGGNQANRRRRRRPRPDGKEESPGKVLPNLIPKIVDLELEPEIEGRKERRETAGTTREIGGVGSSSRISRREEIPTERVSVELTPLEQDVYALMGVSPLIRLDQEFKDPKAVIVAVKTKGDSSVPDTESKVISDQTLEMSLPKADNDIIKLKPEILSVGRRQRTTPIASEPDFSASLSVMADSKTETEEPGMPFKEPMFKEEIEPPIVRRRRRRSSAKEDW